MIMGLFQAHRALFSIGPPQPIAFYLSNRQTAQTTCRRTAKQQRFPSTTADA
jgi:hypothetical protein